MKIQNNLISFITMFFFISTMLGQSSLVRNDDNELRTIILQVQKLLPIDDIETQTFNESFPRTIKILNEVAGLSINKNIPEYPPAEEVILTVSIKLPFLPSACLGLNVQETHGKLPVNGYFILYQSDLSPPELPPPILT